MNSNINPKLNILLKKYVYFNEENFDLNISLLEIMPLSYCVHFILELNELVDVKLNFSNEINLKIYKINKLFI